MLDMTRCHKFLRADESLVPLGWLRQEKLSQLPLNYEKLISVSCTSNKLSRACDFRLMHKIPTDADFEPSGSPAESESWNSPSLHCLAVFSHMAILFVFTCVMNVNYQSIEAFFTSFGL